MRGWSACASEREQARAELMSLEALQKAALREKNARAGAWLSTLADSASRPRLAETLGGAAAGWERAVETVLGDYLEAVGVDALEQLESSLPGLDGGSVTFFEQAPSGRRRPGLPARWQRRCADRRRCARCSSRCAPRPRWPRHCASARSWLPASR
jgi:hypothetical protein